MEVTDADIERSMLLKDELLTYISQEKGTWCAMQGHRSTHFGEAETGVRGKLSTEPLLGFQGKSKVGQDEQYRIG